MDTSNPVENVLRAKYGNPDEPELMKGPKRRAPKYYAGEHVGRWPLQHRDVDRYPNGALPGIRNKAARRIIRQAFRRRQSRIEAHVVRARELGAQAQEIARDKHKSTRWGRRLLALELALHTPAPQPTSRAQDRLASKKQRKKAFRDQLKRDIGRQTNQLRIVKALTAALGVFK